MAHQSRDNYYQFFKLAWHVKEPNTPLVDNFHIKYLCDRLQHEAERIGRGEARGKHLLINIPPGSSKSSIVTIFFPVWCWLRHASMKFITASYSESLAIDHAIKSRDIIKSDWYLRRFSHIYHLKSDQNNKKEYENTHTGKRIITSVGGSVTGKHADIIIADDPINPKKSASEVELRNCKEWWSRTMSTRLSNPKVGLKIIVMQRLHEEDLTGHLLDNNGDEYEHICLPGELTDGVRPLSMREYYDEDGLFDPVRYDREVLDSYKASLGSMGYAGQILQSPAPMEGNMIKRSWYQRFTMSELEQMATKSGKPLVWNFTFDGAYTKDKQNDPSAMLAYAMFDGNMYIRGAMEVWMEMPELLEWMPEYVKANGYTTASRIYVEPKANGLSTVQMLKKNTHLNVIIDKPPTTDKVARVNTCSPFIEARRVYLLQDGEWVEGFINETSMFPNAKNDGRVDCFTMAIDKTNEKGKIHSFEIM